MIELKNVFLSYSKDYNALQDVSCVIKPSERVIVSGEENSGKSSLLRVMVGLEKVTSGEVYIKGIKINEVDFKNVVSLGYLPVQPALMDKTVLQNLEYPLKIRKINKKTQEIKINNALSSYNLEHIKDFSVKDLSYYDKIRLCLARFSLRTIEIFVIDDIFKNLDDSETKKVVEYINDLVNINDATLVVASTDPEKIKKLGGRIVNLDNGSLNT